MKILSIETSCDETAISLIEANGNKKRPEFKVLGNALYSQAEKHKEYGGVYPSLAKREHSLNLVPLLGNLLKETGRQISSKETISKHKKEVEEILKREPDLTQKFIKYISSIKKPDVDLIAVTSGPGLEPALWVGINFAKALSLVWQIPVIPVNHMEGHITSVLKEANSAEQISFPAIALLISGGHTELVLVKNWGKYELIGKTKDDAIGEAYDKVARLLDLEYPGGPKISARADFARENDLIPASVGISLPRPMLNTDDLDFSFSGIKTAVLYLVKKLKEEKEELDMNTKAMIALEFENAVAEVLLKKTTKALEKYSANILIIGGGVIANKNIRETFKELEKTDRRTKVFIPEIDLTTDNAIMIGIAGFLKSFSHKPEINPEIVADGNLKL